LQTVTGSADQQPWRGVLKAGSPWGVAARTCFARFKWADCVCALAHCRRPSAKLWMSADHSLY